MGHTWRGSVNKACALVLILFVWEMDMTSRFKDMCERSVSRMSDYAVSVRICARDRFTEQKKKLNVGNRETFLHYVVITTLPLMCTSLHSGTQSIRIPSATPSHKDRENTHYHKIIAT